MEDDLRTTLLSLESRLIKMEESVGGLESQLGKVGPRKRQNKEGNGAGKGSGKGKGKGKVLANGSSKKRKDLKAEPKAPTILKRPTHKIRPA